MEEPEAKIVRRKLYYTCAAFIKYRGELEQPLSGEKGEDHYKLEHYYDISVSGINQVSEAYFSSLPKVLEVSGSHGKVHGSHAGESYDLYPELLIITEHARVAHEQVEGREIHGYFENIPAAFCMEREETSWVRKVDEVGGTFETPEPLEEIIIADPPLKEQKESIRTQSPGVLINPNSGRGCLRWLPVAALAAYYIFLFNNATPGGRVAFLTWIGIVGTGLLIRSGIGLFRRFPRAGRFFSGIFRRAISLMFLLFFVNGVMHLPDDNRQTKKEDRNAAVPDAVTIDTDDPATDERNNADTKEKGAQKKKIVVRMRWKDLSGRSYSGSYALYAEDVSTSGQRLRAYQSFRKTGYRDIYGHVSAYDGSHMSGVFSMLDSIRSAHKLSDYRFAEVIVTMVQSISYVLVLDGSCSGRQEEPVILELLRTGVPCIGNAPYGLRTPLQFLSDMKGDCDTRTVLLYNLLKHYRYDVAVINSEYYTHSLLGLNLPGITGNYKMHDAKRYYFWETTNKGFPLGELPREAGNINYWNVELN